MMYCEHCSLRSSWRFTLASPPWFQWRILSATISMRVLSYVSYVFTASGRRQQSWDAQEGLRKPRKLCARQGLPRGYGLHNGYVSCLRPDMRWGRLVGLQSISRLFWQSRFGDELGGMRPNQDRNRSLATC